MHRLSLRLAVALLCALGPASPVRPANTERPVLGLQFAGKGVTSLRVGNRQLLADGQMKVKDARLEGWDGTPVEASLAPVRVTVNPGVRRVRLQYQWGSVSCVYAPGLHNLDMTITVANTSSYVLRSILIQPLALRISGEPRRFDGDSRKGSNRGSPTVVGLSYQDGALALVNEDVGRPLYVGFAAGVDDASPNAVYPILVSTAKSPAIPRSWLGDPAIDRPICPGYVDRFRLSIRFGLPGAPMEQLAGDVYAKFAAAYPFRLSWPDRRPIGALFLSSSGLGIRKNPRGWFNDRELDVTTPEGVRQFRERLLAYADASIRILKKMGAQGMITWDVEGQEYPHAISYLGDPRSLPPEMEPVVDEYFSRFRQAGLRTGLCLRPQRPLRPVYGNEVSQVAVYDEAYNLSQKIEYAKKRWGCSLFYVDSNVHFDPTRSPSDGDAYELIDAEVFRKIAAANPDVLLIPEHEDVAYFSCTAPYNELRMGIASTPAQALRVYPGAFSVIAVADGPIDERAAELVAAVKRGDILLFRGWFDDPINEKVRAIYQQAGRARG